MGAEKQERSPDGHREAARLPGGSGETGGTRSQRPRRTEHPDSFGEARKVATQRPRRALGETGSSEGKGARKDRRTWSL